MGDGTWLNLGTDMHVTNAGSKQWRLLGFDCQLKLRSIEIRTLATIEHAKYDLRMLCCPFDCFPNLSQCKAGTRRRDGNNG